MCVIVIRILNAVCMCARKQLGDLKRFLQLYEVWQKRIYPGIAHVDFIEQVEKLGSKGTVQQSLKALRREAMREADEAMMAGDGIGWASGLATKKPRHDADNDDDNDDDDDDDTGIEPMGNANVVNDKDDDDIEDDDDYDQYMGEGHVENNGVDEDELEDLLIDD